MSTSLSEINYKDLILGKRYIIKVNEDFFNQQIPIPEIKKNVLLIGTFDTIECEPEDEIFDDTLYNEIRDRIYLEEPTPQFSKDDKTTFNNGKESSIQDLIQKYPQDRSNICYGTFVNVKQIDTEKTIVTTNITYKNFQPISAVGVSNVTAFLFIISEGKVINNYKFYTLKDDTISRTKLLFFLKNINSKVELPEDIIKQITKYGGKTIKMKRMKKNNLKSRKQKRKKIYNKKGHKK